jgi:hypothetical protein
MSLSQQTMQRLPTIKAELLQGTSYPDIGKKLGVTERTIDRDIKAFVNSGNFETWLKEEWLRLHSQVIHDDPIEAYRNVSKLISRMVTRKELSIVKEDITINRNFNLTHYSEEDKTAILDAYRRINKNNSSPTEPTSLH